MNPRWILRATPLLLLAMARPHPAAALDLDPSFGTGGHVLLPRSSTNGASSIHPGALARNQDGSYWWTIEDGTGGLRLGRLMASGAVDTNFGAGTGAIHIDQCVGNGAAALLAADDGKVIVWTGQCLTRRRADGTLDPVFASNGSIDVATLKQARLMRDAQQRLVLAGAEGNTWRAFRFLANGTPDPNFGSAGQVAPDIPSSNGFRGLEALAIRADDSIVLGGWRGNTHGPNVALFGLTASGTPDPTFGDQGLVDALTASNASARAQAIVATADGSVWVSGESTTGSVSCCLLLTRYTRQGQVDPAVGIRTYALGNENLPPFFEMRAAIGLAGDGVWVARNTFPLTTGHRTQFTLLRLQSNGALDTTFAGRGWRSWFVNHPVSHQPQGDYIQLHDTDFSASTITFFGRTFFEDDGEATDYVTLTRLAVDVLFGSGFE